MADWTAPFHVPKLSDEQYAKQKAEYHAKHGFTITIPGLSDIIKIRTEQPMSALEDYWWKKHEWDKFGPARLEEVRKQKQKRKERYLAMLASPTPAIFQNAGSILTAVDDAQDAISTLAAIGELGKKIAPKILGRILKGPVGLLWTAGDALNLVQNTAMYCMAPMYGKRESESLARGSPAMKKVKKKTRFKTKGRLPTKGDWIQGLQTTEQVFGFGISLGPLVGLAQDIMFASVRAAPGEFARVKFPIPDLKEWEKKAMRTLKSLNALYTIPWSTDDDDILLWTAAAHLSFQTLFSIYGTWNPLEALDDPLELELRAPIPWHTLTREVIAEGPVPFKDALGWPQTSQLWSKINVLIDPCHDSAVHNMSGYYGRNNHSWHGWVAGQCTSDLTAYALACLEGPEDVHYDYVMPMKAVTTMISGGYFLDPNQPDAKFELFRDFLDDCEESLWNPTMENIIQFCTSPWNDIKLLKQVPTVGL